MNWRTPLPPLGMMVAVAVLAGVSVVQVFPWLPPLWASAALLAAAAILFRQSDGCRFIGGVLFGIAWACLVGQSVMESRLPTALSRQDFAIEGQVLGLPQREDESIRFDFRIEKGSVGAPVGERVRLGWYGQVVPKIEPGSRWQFRVRLKRPMGVLNPGGRDFERSALAMRIAATGYVREPGLARQLHPGRGVDRLRDQISARIAQALPEGNGRFVQALAVGDTRNIQPGDWEVLRATGLTHQIAISGFHVGMVGGLGALLMSALFRLFPGWGRRLPRPQAVALAAMFSAFAYTALAGFALPTVRTWLMIAVVLSARLLRRPQSGRESYALALVAVLLFDPLSVLAPGFWLSFAGVGWLIWCLPQSRGTGHVRSFLQAQGVAVLGLLPLTIWFFGQASIPGPVANLVGVPVISLCVVPLALLGLLLSTVSATAAAFCWHASARVMDWLWSALEAMADWPGSMMWLAETGFVAFALACLAAFWLLLPRGTPGRALACVLFLPMLWPDLNPPAPGQVEIRVIDVGQGLSVLVQTASHNLLFDAAAASPRGLDMGEAAVVPTLRALGVSHLDTLLISHGDNDHSGGMQAVVRAYPGVRVLGVEGWARPGMGLCQSTQAWRWDGVNFRVLHPPPLFPYLRNDSSCVLRIEAGGRVALLPGDIGRQVEQRLLNMHPGELQADLLLVPHHGSLTSSSTPFIHQVAPRWAVVSAGAENRFGLPRAEVLDRYSRTGSIVLNTASAGAIAFRLDASGAQLISERRGDRPRYWREPANPGSGYAIGNQSSDR
ncbi:MAG: DNA internalization-related competence protein ComEC/Rec2 [Gammaproteobacteria bacterium RIFCSPHIGHO2_12_FULL_63_22]|nr:MAG: DNA internalization-related competence protein ComEC/Rec2 [Gammaproteobacteria bacterium RIFCSPHIGHO2_12_FULL_63_22]